MAFNREESIEIKNNCKLKLHNLKNKILIIGSIADFGGREVEVKNIIVALSKAYDVRLFSTVPITEHSMAISGLNCRWTSLHKELYHSNFFLKALSLFSKKWNKSDLPSYLLVSNKISKVFFDFNTANKQILNKQIDSVQAVVFCGVLTNGFLKEIMNYCLQTNKPFILRITGTIVEIPFDIRDILAQIFSIVVHSFSNATIFKNNNLINFNIIDQTTLLEKSLLKIQISKNKNLTYGYIGRFSNEKGIVELLESFEKLNKKLIICGDGPLLETVNFYCENNSFLENVGKIPSNQIADFFKKIDVLIIPSFEESGPLVGIEALAAGKLIVSTKVGAMMDRLYNTNNQFWFDIDNTTSLIETLVEIENLDIDLRIAIRKELRELYRHKYSQNVIAQQYLNVVDNCFLNR